MQAGSLEIPNEALNALCRTYEVRELSVFGSALREDFGPDSDIDLLMSFEPGARVGFLTLARLERQLFEQAEGPVDALDRRHLVLRSVGIPVSGVVVRGSRRR